jgi:signal transduction histidine kinase
MKIAEVQHLEGIKGNFMVSEGEYLAPAATKATSYVASQIIYSNLMGIVENQQYIFDTLWNKAIPATKRIREIEEGIVHVETKVLENPDEIFNHVKYVIENASDRSVCFSTGVMQLVHDKFFDLYKKIIDKHRKGEGEGVRWITTVDNDSKDLVKIFLDAGTQIRHVKTLPPMNFAVDDRYFHATVEKIDGGKMIRSLLTSNEPVYVKHYKSIFEDLWKNGIDAVQRISDINEGIDLADIEVIPRSSRAGIVYLELVRNAKEELLFIFPTTNAFIRQDKLGAIPLALETARERNVKVRILVPYNQAVENRLAEEVPGKEEHRIYNHNMDIRYIEQMSGTKATILVGDRKESLVMELRDDSKATFEEAIGLSTYSNSKAGVLSYVAIFENLWRQTELYEQLKNQDMMQKEFINIAAHELRTPIQPILALTEIVHSQTKDVKQKELLAVTIRNAHRLQHLTNDILDVSKIDGKSLELKKENFDLNDVILDAINDIILDKDFLKNEKIKLSYDLQNILIHADKERISQVVFNLLSNAVKFTTEGTIIVSVKGPEDKNNNNTNDKTINVSVKDPGQGIDSSILPRLFTKFASRSYKGTGLGLFISKGIIEAHGGTIWGENNANRIGATFSFRLPAKSNLNDA